MGWFYLLTKWDDPPSKVWGVAVCWKQKDPGWEHYLTHLFEVMFFCFGETLGLIFIMIRWNHYPSKLWKCYLGPRWWFPRFFIFIPPWGKMIQFDGCIFFKWVGSTTNYIVTIFLEFSWIFGGDPIGITTETSPRVWILELPRVGIPR